MAWIQIHGESSRIGMNIAFHALIPQQDDSGAHGPKQNGPYKVIYLLHGYSDNSAHWLRMTAIERETHTKPIAIIMPETDNAFWLNTHTQWNYFDYLTQELPDLCQKYFPISDKKEDTMISGFSMGGYGALNAALNCPDKFGYCAAFAPAIELWTMYERERPLKAPWILGDKDAFIASMRNPYIALEARRAAGDMPKTMITVGKEDGLKPQSDRFTEKAAQLGLDIAYQPVDGRHDWYFAESAFLRALDWFEKEGK